MARVLVVGGGISGLAAAHRVMEQLAGVEVTVLEAGPRAGGLVRTERTDGYVIERGPDAMLTDKPAGVRLAERLGLSDELVATRAEHRGAYVVHRGRLQRLPEGFALLAPTRAGPFLRSPVLSWGSKARAGLDLVLPRGRGREDESLASFVERRFGREVLERLAQPLAGGIYGADPDRLSLHATMPRFIEAERAHRSVSLGLRRRQRTAAGAAGGSSVRYGMFVSFRRGMQALVDALLQRLDGRVQLQTPVQAIEPGGDGWSARIGGGRTVHADAVVMAVPAFVASRLVAGVDAELAAQLAAVRYGSNAAVTFAWPRDRIPRPLDAFGFVVPQVEGRLLLACTWSSVKWPGRAPEGMELIRAFIGGRRREEVVRWSDAELQDAARRELRSLMGIEADPVLARVDRYERAMPQYELGHRQRVQRIEALAARHPGLALAGNAYYGVGVPDAVRSGEGAADGLATVLVR